MAAYQRHTGGTPFCTGMPPLTYTNTDSYVKSGTGGIHLHYYFLFLISFNLPEM
jgi:hypothetical protein